MQMKKSPKEGFAARGFGRPNIKALKRAVDVRFKAIYAFIAEIELRLDQIEELIKDLHEKELGV